MSCWVVPAVAAEMWGVPLERILEQVRSGMIPSRIEGGFTFVNVAQGSERRMEAPRSVIGPKPDTFRVVTNEEIRALTRDDPVGTPEHAPLTENATLSGDWREGRRLAGGLRRPPR